MLSAEQIIATLWRWRLIVVLTFALLMSGVVTVTFSLPKVYGSDAYLWVSSAGQTASDYEATQTNQVLSKTYAELLQTRGAANAVAAALPFRMGGVEVSKAVTVTPIPQSQLIRISAEAKTPERARIIAETYGGVFLARAGDLDSKNGMTRRITLAEPALAVEDPIRPRPALYLLIGSILAGCCAVTAAFVRQRFDTRLDIDGATTEVLGLPILARVPQTPVASALGASFGGRLDAGSEQMLDAFRSLLTNLAFANGGTLPRSVAVVSAEPGEGKSTCSVGIGFVAVEMGVRTVLVDADLRRPRLSSMLGVKDEAAPGFSDMLRGSVPLALGEVAREAPGSALRFVPSGDIPSNPASLLDRSNLKGFERRARNLFDLIVYDSPPLSIGPDASLVAVSADAAILVINGQKTRGTAVLQAVDQLRRSNTRVLGVVVNRLVENPARSYYNYRDGERGAERKGVAAVLSDSSPTSEGPRAERR